MKDEVGRQRRLPEIGRMDALDAVVPGEVGGVQSQQFGQAGRLHEGD